MRLLSHVYTLSRFPITRGDHAGFPCQTCHTDPNAPHSFTCLTCHGRGEMDREHRDRSGYRYDSLGCLSCYPQGRE